MPSSEPYAWRNVRVGGGVVRQAAAFPADVRRQAITHLRRHEPPAIAANLVLLVLAAVVAWGRFGPYPFH